MIIGIDASRNRSGGTLAHLVGFLENISPNKDRFQEVHIWSHKEFLNELPNDKWLIKHNPHYLEKNITFKLFWQKFILSKELKRTGCNILFNTTASSISKFHPNVTLSQDMLPFEPGETKRFGFSVARLRLKILFFLYVSSLQRSDSSIFLTNYAANMIQKKTGALSHVYVIPHGVPDFFRIGHIESIKSIEPNQRINIIYISEISPYKHQWSVLEAVKTLRTYGYDIKITFVGGGSGKAMRKFNRVLKTVDPEAKFVKTLSFIARNRLPDLIAISDIFLFASSCENLPITVLEGMASAKPIACSDRGPMPEVLGDCAFYFNPEDSNSIAESLERIIVDRDLVKQKTQDSLMRSNDFTWKRCARETMQCLNETNKRFNST